MPADDVATAVRAKCSTQAELPLPPLAASTELPRVTVGSRALVATEVFTSYWRFAAERQSVYLARLGGQQPPWTSDPVIARHRFTNAYRAADRVSQYLIGRVAWVDEYDLPEVVFRVLLFKMFNKVETWEHLEGCVGDITWSSYDFDRYEAALTRRASVGDRLYSAAYVIPPPRFGESAKHRNHLRLLEHMMRDGLPGALAAARSLRDVYLALRAYPSVGDFLAFQWAVDLNYAPPFCFPEADFVVAGPGAVDGVRKCFGVSSAGVEVEVIHRVTEMQHDCFVASGQRFDGLFGRALQPIDCQNLFCEIGKYARVVHPDAQGVSNRSRIKQGFAPSGPIPRPFFPPPWGINATVMEWLAQTRSGVAYGT